jgi:hypothetical protein
MNYSLLTSRSFAIFSFNWMIRFLPPRHSKSQETPKEMLGICFFTLSENNLRAPDREGEKGVVPLP